MDKFFEKIREALENYSISELNEILDELDKNTELTENEIVYIRQNIEGNIEALYEEQSLYW